MSGQSKPETVFERFEAVANAHRDDCAFDDGRRTLTYGALLDRANAAAKAIVEIERDGAGIVGILTTDRINAMAAMFGVAASGHAYVLLDAGDPDKRLSSIIAEAAPFAILADDSLCDKARAAASNQCPILGIDALKPSSARAKAKIEATGDSLLYVSFTSGSTGVPKGVCQNHRNLIFFVDRFIETMGIKAGDPISWLFAHGVSASNMDIYGALFTGAKLCTFELRDQSFPAMADWIDRERLTLLHSVPTVARELAAAVAKDRIFESVDVVDLAGEMLFANDVAKMRPHFRKDCLILNRLAATEASFIASMKVTKAHEKWNGALPVGTAPDGVEISILGEDGKPIEPGAQGYIAISSPHVALGYLNRPELNDAAFADVDGRPGWRRYTSADLGFVDADGNLNFIGRSGSRIKLRGQAVDLAEVEAALHQCPGVAGAVVLAQAGEGEEAKAINAFLILGPGTSEDIGDIRKALTEFLPASMLPSGYVFLDQFPTTATSKVDRQALAKMDLAKARYRPGYEPPEDEGEARVAAIFEEVLGVKGVGRLDDFFALGGDSLSLVNLQILAAETFGRQFERIHEDGSVRAVAEVLRDGPTDRGGLSPLILPIRTEGSAPPLFMVHGRRGIAHVSPRFLELLGPDQPLYSIQARGLDGKQEPHTNLHDMAAEYVAVVRQAQPEGPYFIGGFCAGSFVAIEMARLFRQAGDLLYRPLLIDPPIPNFPRAGDALDEERLLGSIKRRVGIGQWKVDLESESMVDAAIRVARACEDALHSYEYRPMRMPAMIIASQKRWKNFQNVRKIFGPNVVGMIVQGRHADILSPENRSFALAIHQCITHVAAAAAARESQRLA